MRKLNTEEGIKEESKFLNKFEEFEKKLCEINKKENSLINSNSLTKELELKFEEDRNILKKNMKDIIVYIVQIFTVF